MRLARPHPATLFAVFAAGLLFALGAAPGLTWLDAGELGAAAWELGIAHPPGFPVFLMLHKAVMLLLPVGEIAFRGNLASGALGLAALALMIAAARTLGISAVSAAAAALLVATSGLFLEHAVTIEVYTGAAAFTAFVLLAFARLRRDGDLRWAVALGLAIGLAAGHHAELRLFALLLLAPGLRFALRRGAPRLPVALALGAAVLGAACIVYLPLRALAEPNRDWGDPRTLSALWDHLMAARIRRAYSGQFGTVSPEALATLGSQLARHAPVLAVLGIAGLLRLARRPGGWLVGLVWAADAIYATTLNPMGLGDLQNGVPGCVALGLGAAATLDALSGLAHRRWSPRRAGLASATVAGVAVGVGAAVTLPAGPRDGDRGEPRVIARFTDRAPPKAVALVAGDNLAAGLAFVQVVEGARPDVAVIVRQHAGYRSSVGPVARRLPETMQGWSPGAARRWMAELPARPTPIWWEWARGLDAGIRPPNLAPAFPMFAVSGADDGTFEGDVETILADLPPRGLDEPQAGRALAGLMMDLGLFRLAQGHPSGAVAAIGRATELAPGWVPVWTNLGNAFAGAGDYAHAIDATRRALALAPESRLAQVNISRFLMNAGRTDEAAREIDALLTADRRDPDARGLRGMLRAGRRDWAGAAVDFTFALMTDATQAEAVVGSALLRKAAARKP